MDVDVQLVVPRRLASVRREVVAGEVGSAWRPALDLVWAFVRTQPGLWTDGHNVFVYHHSTDAPLRCEFGVEVTRTFDPAGEVYPTETPAGEAAVAVHRGSYDLTEAYDAITRWMASNDREPAGHSWEIYGDPTPDPAGNETTVFQLLRPRQP
ncbi:GyrI-like domain-containing protein [Kribbella sp. NPDC004536]|uniref:GyrI-like domain-containing protein n=1 Tax=Kribbella sp. NPDC004536 TaxID=3364106 RepID=UPI0036B33140